MKTFKQWYEENREYLNSLTRQQLAQDAWMAANLIKPEEKPVLEFDGDLITDYATNVILTLKNENGFSFSSQQIFENSMQLQQSLIVRQEIRLDEWIGITTKNAAPVVLEFSPQDIINYQALAEPGDNNCFTECKTSLLAYVSVSTAMILVIQITPKHHEPRQPDQ